MVEAFRRRAVRQALQGVLITCCKRGIQLILQRYLHGMMRSMQSRGVRFI
jgi:hypothetical protein